MKVRNDMSHKDKIIIQGLKQNNLKNVSLEIPKEKIVVFTGVSGSGKSSIVFDTIAAESQRQMNETYTAFIQKTASGFYRQSHCLCYHRPDEAGRERAFHSGDHQ